MTERRVAHVLPGLDRSGLFMGLATEARRYRPEFWIVGELDRDFEERLVESRTPFRRFPEATPRGLPKLVAELHRSARRERPDVLHGHLLLEGAATALAGRWAGIPSVVTRHHSDYHQRAGQWRGVLVDRATAALTDRVIAVSEHTRQVVVEREGAAPDRVVAIPNGVGARRIPMPDPDRRAAARTEFEMDERWTAVLVGRLHEEKGQSVAIQAVASLRRRGVQVQLLLVGGGPAEARLRAEVIDAGVADRVHFTGFRSDAVELMAAAEVVLLPSRAEAFGLVAVEAVAAGAPVIAARTGGLPEILEGRPGCRLVPAGDAGALARAIRGCREWTGPGRTPWGNPMGRSILEEFTMSAMIRGIEAVYDGVVR